MADPCEHCAPIIETMKTDLVKLVSDMLASDCELVRIYAVRHGLIDGAGAQTAPVHHPRDVAQGVLRVLREAGADVPEHEFESLRIRAALLQNLNRSVVE